MKVAIVTGASGGIGSQIAIKLCENGYAVVGCYRNNGDVCEALASEINGSGGLFQPYRADVSEDNDVQNLIDYTAKTFGRIDLLVNCAGIGEIAPFCECSRWKEIIDVNLCGTIRTCKAATEIMLRQHSGNIINISSVWGNVGAACEAVYSASKGGINSLTKALAKELGIMGIRVNAVSPGYIETEMNSSLTSEDVARIRDEIPLNRLGNTEDVARTVLFLAEENSSYITGQIITVDGGWTN